jgi:cell surface protein SprA
MEEYQEINLQRSLQSYWRERSLGSNAGRSTGIIPQIHIGGEVFDRIFGGNTIDIRPQGSAEVTFGILSNFTDDPALIFGREELQILISAKDSNECYGQDW